VAHRVDERDVGAGADREVEGGLDVRAADEGRVAAFEDIATMHARSRRRGRVRPSAAADVPALAAALRATPNVTEVAVDDGAVSFACTGEMDGLVKTLATFSIAVLDVTQADLEDAFFSAYDAGTP
jgi:hypothetical protein